MSEANHTAVHNALENFAGFATRERERLTADREHIRGQQEALQRILDEINREFAAIEAYEAAKTGKRATAPRQQRVRVGGRREEVMDHIRNSDGLTRGDLLERMGLKGDRVGEMSVSNALTALKKTGHVHHDGRAYHVPAAQGETVTLAQAAE